MNPAIAYHWRPLQDLPEDWPRLSIPDIQPLARNWVQHRRKLEGWGALYDFNERLSRELAIETGIIEHLYTLDRGTTVLLIEQGIDAAIIPRTSTNHDPEYVAALIKDQHAAVQGLFDFVKQDRQLSAGYIRELHAQLTHHQETTQALTITGALIDVPLQRGEWKRQPNNPTRPDGAVHEYCPPEQVASEVDRLIELHQEHLRRGVSPEVEAAWLHHQFTQIHPFQDGNGRVARCLASLVFIRAGWFPLVVRREDRERYIESLELADQGDLSALIQLFARQEKESFRMSLAVAEKVMKQRLRSAVLTARQRVEERRAEQSKGTGWSAFVVTAQRLEEYALQRCSRLASELTDEIGDIDPDVHFEATSGRDDGVPSGATMTSGASLGSDTAGYRRVVVLGLGSTHSIEIRFSTLEPAEYPAIVVSSELQWSEAGRRLMSHLSDEPFQFMPSESFQDVMTRFEPWLEEVLVRGIENWQS